MSKSFVIAALAALPLVMATGAKAADLDDDAYRQLHNSRVSRDYDYERHRGDWREPRPERSIVEARGSYSGGYLPYHAAEWRARRSAIEAWKYKVERIFGSRFAHWRDASNKRINCDRAGRGVIECIASAQPERGEGGRRWGSWNWRRTNY